MCSKPKVPAPVVQETPPAPPPPPPPAQAPDSPALNERSAADQSDELNRRNSTSGRRSLRIDLGGTPGRSGLNIPL